LIELPEGACAQKQDLSHEDVGKTEYMLSDFACGPLTNATGYGA
jgi:hypothetical protein